MSNPIEHAWIQKCWEDSLGNTFQVSIPFETAPDDLTWDPEELDWEWLLRRETVSPRPCEKIPF